jgi:hypothetical protein
MKVVLPDPGKLDKGELVTLVRWVQTMLYGKMEAEDDDFPDAADFIEDTDGELRAAGLGPTFEDDEPEPEDNDCPNCGGSGGGDAPMHCPVCGGTGLKRSRRGREEP